MNKSRHLVPKEHEYAEKIKKIRDEVFEKEKRLFSLVDDFVSINASIREFYKNAYLPRLGKYILKLEKIKEKILGKEEKREDEEKKDDVKKLEEAAKPTKEMKILYRKLAKLYHPDKAEGDKEFLTRRMEEINEAFAKGDIKSLERFMKRADAEMGLTLSSPERLRYLETDSSVIGEMIVLYEKKIELLKENSMYKLMKKSPSEREETFRDMEKRLRFEIEINEKLAEKLSKA